MDFVIVQGGILVLFALDSAKYDPVKLHLFEQLEQ